MRYVAVVTATCVGVALLIDGVNQLVFFQDWATCFRNWAVTAALTLGLSVPISRTIGKAHLELYRAKALADGLARTDQLTGLPNRRALMEAVDVDGQDAALALVIVDIDRFKRVNDLHGHMAGDVVIRAVGHMLAADLGALGFVARIGGEEFALLSSGASTRLLAAGLNAFREKIQMTPILAEGAIIQVTISAGVAMREDGHNFARMFSEADRALYAAKTGGRNRVCLAQSVKDAAEAKPIQRSA